MNESQNAPVGTGKASTHRCSFGWAARLAALLLGTSVAACGEPSLPAPVSVSLQRPGELAHLQFESKHTHGYYISLELHYPQGDSRPQPELRLPAVTIATHLTVRRIGAAAGPVIFDGDEDAMQMGYGTDSFDRNLHGKFVLPPGHYDVVVTLLKAAPQFAQYPTQLSVSSDRGHAVYGD